MCEAYSLDMSPDTLRKAGVGIKLASDAGWSYRTNDVTDGYVERQKIRDLNKVFNAQMRVESRSELLRETIREAVSELPSIEVVQKEAVHDGDKSLVVALGDFHYGADICVKGIYGDEVNVFNSLVFEDRMNRLLGEVIAIAQKERATDINIMMVGDLIDGILRTSQLMRLEYGIVDSVIYLSEFLSEWIAEIAKYVPVNVYAVTGNHPEIRPLKTKAREFDEENLERIMMWYIAERMRDVDNVCVDPECDRMKCVDVCGKKFLLLHGDGENRMEKIAMDSVNMYGHPIDFFVCGHKHREEEIHTGVTGSGSSVVIRVPSLCGVDKYAQSKGYGGRPGATVIVMEEGRGRRCVYPIEL